MSTMEKPDPVEQKAIEAAWNRETARRIAEMDSGTVAGIPWEEVQKQILAKLKHAR